MLTEAQVERSFRLLIKGPEISEKILDKAEALLQDLRPESPLRHRLASEVDELRELRLAK